MDDFFSSDLFKILAAAVVLGVVGKVVWRLVFPEKQLLQERVRCAICGWRGTIGKYNRKCSKCGSTTLEGVK